MKVHVLLKKEELEGERLAGKVVVVLDVLFATSSIVAALAAGARSVVPALDRESCLAAAKGEAEGSYILSGELNAQTLEGFTAPSPLALTAQPMRGRTLFYATTNGTVALHKAAEAEHVYAAALLNGRAVVERLMAKHAGATVLVVCSGSIDNFNLEDFYGAGHLVSTLVQHAGSAVELSDAARAASLLHARSDALECLASSRVGRMMQVRGAMHEVEFCARTDVFEVVPKLVDGRLENHR
jgi:2-phosphosulfolactate phosphatase